MDFSPRHGLAGSQKTLIAVRRVFGITLLLALASVISFAADATFSKDGQHVYAIESETSHLFDIDIAKQSASKIDIGPLINNEPVVAIATSNSGDVLVATAHDAWSCDIDKKSCTKLCSAPEGVEFKEMAYNPKTDALLFSTRTGVDLFEGSKLDPTEGAFLLEHGAAKPLPVAMRRVAYMRGIAFSSDGQLFFGTDGDLWQGLIITSANSAAGDMRVLDALRCCPLANSETTDATPLQIGVADVAVGHEKLYVLLDSLNASGGKILRLRRPPARLTRKEFDQLYDLGEDEVGARLKLYIEEASSVEMVGDSAGGSRLCTTSDGQRTFFSYGRLGGEMKAKVYIVENDGKPRELSVKLPEQAAPTPTRRPQKHPVEAEPDYIKRLKQQAGELLATPRPSP
jgi:hypothetical protein